VKIGEITKSSRTEVQVGGPVFSFDSERDSYDTFCSKVEERVVESLQTYPKKTIRLDMSIYIKPNNLAPLVAAAYTNYQKRTKDSGPFEIEVYVLTAKKERRTLPGTRRATASRIQKATAKARAQVEENARTQWSISHARKPQGSTFTLPDTATFAQAQHPDVMLAEEKVEEESEYGTVNLSNYNLLTREVFFFFVPPHEPDEDAEDLDHDSD
ncbi:hypothetical protein GN958_ATG15111, partial [Phytophthora infestans]